MKKTIILSLLFTLVSICVNAQSPEYLTFKGIELKPGMKLRPFVEQLKAKGMTIAPESLHLTNGTYALKGRFQNISDCSLYVLPLDGNPESLGCVGVSFPYQEHFADLKSRYDDIKSALSSKYVLKECYEGFDDNYVAKTTSDYSKMRAIKNHEATFQSMFVLSNDPLTIIKGYIRLSIAHLEVELQDYYFVSLAYITPDNVKSQMEGDDDI